MLRLSSPSSWVKCDKNPLFLSYLLVWCCARFCSWSCTLCLIHYGMPLNTLNHLNRVISDPFPSPQYFHGHLKNTLSDPTYTQRSRSLPLGYTSQTSLPSGQPARPQQQSSLSSIPYLQCCHPMPLSVSWPWTFPRPLTPYGTPH